MVSYADMITILMAFFAVMFSMAVSKDAKKDGPLIKSLQRQFGKLGGEPTTRYIPFGAALTGNPADSTAEHASRPPNAAGRFRGFRHDPARRPGHDRRRDLLRLSHERPERRPAATTPQVGSSSGRQAPADRDPGPHPRPHGRYRRRSPRQLGFGSCPLRQYQRYLVSLGIDRRRIRLGIAARFEPIVADRDALLLQENSSVEVFMPLDSDADRIVETGAQARN